jgi:hypothetical protein
VLIKELAMPLQYILHHPQGFVVDGSPVNAIGPFPTWDAAHQFYYSPDFPRERDGETSLEAIYVPAA